VLRRALTERDWAPSSSTHLRPRLALDTHGCMQIGSRSARPPKLVYNLATNHYVTWRSASPVPSRLAASSGRSLPFKNRAARSAAWCRSRSSVTSTRRTLPDLRRRPPTAPVAFLPAGSIRARAWRRAPSCPSPSFPSLVFCLSSSFDWPPKAHCHGKLPCLLPRRSSAGAGLERLQIVGAIEPDYLAAVRARHPFVFLRQARRKNNNVRPYLAVRRGSLLVARRCLGGFRAHGPRLVFNRWFGEVIEMRRKSPSFLFFFGGWCRHAARGGPAHRPVYAIRLLPRSCSRK